MDTPDSRLSPVPTTTEVLEHGFDFRPSWWQQYLPPEWGSFLDDLPESARGNGYRRLTRGDLISLGQGVGPDDPVRTLVACYAWGAGEDGWVARLAKTFSKNKPDVLRSRLGTAQSVLLDDGPAAAMDSLSYRGPNRIPYLGPSFFTKFLYAVNSSDDDSPQRALIMDQFVAIALNDIDGWGLEELPSVRPTQDYLRWLAHAHTLAESFSAASSEVVRADAIEMTYFRHGKRVEYERRSR